MERELQLRIGHDRTQEVFVNPCFYVSGAFSNVDGDAASTSELINCIASSLLRETVLTCIERATLNYGKNYLRQC